MTLPHSYNNINFHEILDQFPDLHIFHQTGISSLVPILAEKRIYSTGTMWGMDNNRRTSAAKSSNQALGWKETAKNGFIDYVFTTSINNIANGVRLYGTISFEFSKQVLLERDTFIFPKTTRFDFNSFATWEKNSDTTTWLMVLRNPPKHSKHEILVRKQLKLDHLIRIHCFKSSEKKVKVALQGTAFEGIDVSVHEDPKATGNPDMKALISGIQYDAYYTDASHKKVRIFSPVDDEYDEFFGEYEIEGDNILDDVFLTSEKVIVGQLHRDDGSVKSMASASI